MEVIIIYLVVEIKVGKWGNIIIFKGLDTFFVGMKRGIEGYWVNYV